MCIEDGCQNPVYVAARGLCRNHWRAHKNAGTLGPLLTQGGRPAGGQCAADECERTDLQGDGLCRLHYKRAYRAANKDKLNAQARALVAANPQKAKATQDRWLANPENRAKHRASVKRWQEANADRAREYRRQRWTEHRERLSAQHLEWARANPEKACDSTARRRARRRANDERVITENDLSHVYASPCIYCGATEDITADHVIPVSRGGRHAIGNLVPACGSCNSSKRDKTIMEWRIQRRG